MELQKSYSLPKNVQKLNMQGLDGVNPARVRVSLLFRHELSDVHICTNGCQPNGDHDSRHRCDIIRPM